MSSARSNQEASRRSNPFLSAVCRQVREMDAEVLDALCPAYEELISKKARYSELKQIGQGALKDVFRALDLRTHRWVALARLRTNRDVLFYDRFIQEARLIASLQHPNIIKVHDAGVNADGRPFFTMDLKGNQTLADLIKNRGTTPLPERLEVFLKICDAVAYAHAQGVIHLDLKPDNIQCDQFGEVLVCDWGLAQRVGDVVSYSDAPLPKSTSEDLTLTGKIQGTLGYMAPEQVIPDGSRDERTDIYALGCLLHAILCEEPPFSGAVKDVLESTLDQAVPSLSRRYPDRSIPFGLEAVVLKATSKKPADRYDSVLALQNEIQNYLGGFATVAEQPGFFREAKLFLNRNRIPTVLTLGSLMLLSMLSVLWVQSLEQARAAAREEHVRANQLLSEKAMLNHEFSSFQKESEQSLRENAERMAAYVRKLKSSEVYERPVEMGVQAEHVLRFALRQCPESHKTHWQFFLLHVMTMNFHQALQDRIGTPPVFYAEMMPIAKRFSAYEFSEHSRPSRAQLIALFYGAYSISPKFSGLMEGIFSYHCATMPQHANDVDVMRAFLSYFNGGGATLSVAYDPVLEAMSLTSLADLRLLFETHGSSGRSLLRFFRIQSLTLACEETVTLSELNLLEVKVLDLSRCHAVNLDTPIFMPKLKQLIVRRGQLSEDQVQPWISSNDSIDLHVLSSE